MGRKHSNSTFTMPYHAIVSIALLISASPMICFEINYRTMSIFLDPIKYRTLLQLNTSCLSGQCTQSQMILTLICEPFPNYCHNAGRSQICRTLVHALALHISWPGTKGAKHKARFHYTTTAAREKVSS